MPAKNSRKEYCEDSFYHLYNRGVEKRLIFVDDFDRAVFLSYLSVYLMPKNIKLLQSMLADSKTSSKEKDTALKLLRMNNFYGDIELLSYCLMPNHFHFLVWQREANTIDRFMNSLGVRYCVYFNRRYKRVGHLFQGVYKAVHIVSDEQLLHSTRYIHRNPNELLASQDQVLRSYEWSSYSNYLGTRKTEWVIPDRAMKLLNGGSLAYRSFVEDQDAEEEMRRVLIGVDVDSD